VKRILRATLIGIGALYRRALEKSRYMRVGMKSFSISRSHSTKELNLNAVGERRRLAVIESFTFPVSRDCMAFEL
jgi:hypothetical protein